MARAIGVDPHVLDAYILDHASMMLDITPRLIHKLAGGRPDLPAGTCALPR
jgi:hypothetical protein